MYKKIMIALFALFLIQLPLFTFVFMPAEAQPFSENENRYLARFPKLSFQTIENKEFMNGFDEWISDRFIGREQWITLKNKTETTIGKTEISGVYTENDRMIEAWRSYDQELFNKNLEAINSFAGRFPNTPMYFLLAPNAQEIYSHTLPAYAQTTSQKTFIKNFYSGLTNFAGTIDAYSLLNNSSDDYIYYRTDHHWTSLGAYYAYYSAGSKLGYTPYNLSDFTIEHASSSFRGTLFSKTLDSGVTPDIIDYYKLSQNSPTATVSVLSDGGKYTTHDGMYFREYLEKKDKYASYLGQNSAVVTIDTDIADGGSILVIKDSYAHSFVPFLANHFSKITMLDLRYINTDFQQYVSLDDYDEVLFLYNVITFSEESSISKLNFTK